MAILDNGDKSYKQMVVEIQLGQIKIPQFQRKFVWDIKASAKLIDSILKGYPIGTFIYWNTNEQLRSVRNIGNIDLPVHKDGESVNYVLDGQQRLTSFFAAINGVEIEREDGKKEDYSRIYVDLEADGEDEYIITDILDKNEKTFIQLKDLISSDFQYLASFPPEKQEKISVLRKTLEGYIFKGVNLKEADINIATEVFTRLNVGGKELTLFEIMVAKTYDATKKFDLSEKYDQLINRLEKVDYETISPQVVLHVVSMLLVKNVTRKEILKIKKQDFINIWDHAINCLESAVDFLRCFGVQVSRLLPYNALIVPFSLFFDQHPDKPSGITLKYLEDFFWRCSLGYRYSSGTENKLAQDAEKIIKIINNELPKYEWSIDISAQTIKSTGEFSTGKSYIKALLCLYAINRPKSFNNNLDVRIDNAWLKIATSKNYHHFFPKAWMKKNYPTLDESHYNHILNITIVDDFLNKKKIKDKPPSKYIRDFHENNTSLSDSLKSHFIGDVNEFGIYTDDYELFFDKRAELVQNELRKRIIEQQTGNDIQIENIGDDIDE
jgi:hypothetical protein